MRSSIFNHPEVSDRSPRRAKQAWFDFTFVDTMSGAIRRVVLFWSISHPLPVVSILCGFFASTLRTLRFVFLTVKKKLNRKERKVVAKARKSNQSRMHVYFAHDKYGVNGAVSRGAA